MSTLTATFVETATAAVALSSVLVRVRLFIRRFVVLSAEQATAVALWVAHTHAIDAAECTPYLHATSATKRAGKTRLLEAVEPLVARPWFTGRTSAAALVRKIDDTSPTLLFDEADANFGGEKEFAEALRGVLNTGYRRSGKATICVGHRAVGITSLRWNVNLLGPGVGWVQAEYLDRLHAVGCSIQLAANGWVNSRDAKPIVGHTYRTIAAHPIRKSLFSNATHISPLNPWLHLYYVTTGFNPLGQQVNPGEQLTRRQALRLRSAESSWFMRMEDRLGTIEPGRYADLAVLDRDYFSVADADIKKIQSVLTLVDGAIVHETLVVRGR